jgi:FlaA1/EpsC-like NDP-sugar epimerase
MEENPVAVIENNVFGTKNLLDAALENGVHRFVLISTDKAVSPVSVYGVSKMLCEKLVLDAAAKARVQDSFMFVRFGNVLGSRGSVLPVFMAQLKAGLPLTVTHPEMKRFFMTIPEACSLVLETGGVGQNGSTYLLDMGEPIKILDLAEQVIRFSGYEPYKDVDIILTGLRKGERLDEPLWLEEEDPTPTEYPKILRLRSSCMGESLQLLLDKLAPTCIFNATRPDLYRNSEYLVQTLCDAVPSLKEFYDEQAE